MSGRGTLTLAILFVLLLGGYYFVIYNDVRGVEQGEVDKLIFELATDDVRAVSITRLSEQTVAASRTDGDWSINQPYEVAAAGPAWELICQEIGQIQNERTIEQKPSDLNIYELNNPKVTVEFETVDGESHELRFGAAEPSQRNRFAQVDGGPVILIDNVSYQKFDRPFTDLRNRFLVGMGQTAIKEMVLTRFKESQERDDSKPDELAYAIEQQTVSFELRDDGKWWQTAPVDALAHQGRVAEMAAAVQFAVGENHVDRPESLEDYGLDPARARLIVTLENGDSSTLYFGELTGSGNTRHMYAKRGDEPSVFILDPQVPNSFPKSPQEFRDHRLLTRGLGGVERVTLDGPSGFVELSIDETGAWVITAPVQEPSDQATVSAYLSYLVTAEGESFPGEEMGASRLEDPWLTLSLYYGGETEPTTIHFGDAAFDDETQFVRRDNGEAMIVRNIVVNAFDATLFNFRPKRLCPIRKREANRLGITLDGEKYEFALIQGRWNVTSPDNRVWERQSDMELLLDSVCNAKALDTVDIDEAAAGLERPVFTVSIEGAGEAAAYEIGGAVEGSEQMRYTRVAGSDEVLLIEQRVLDRVREALRGIVPQR